MFKRLEIAALVPHEQFREDHKNEIMGVIRSDGMLKRPIAVYNLAKYSLPGKYLIIDGHHRTESLKELGCMYIEANEMDYFDDRIKVHSWNNGKDWEKDVIIRDALAGKLMAPKTTRHTILNGSEERVFQDNDNVEPLLNCNISDLK